MTAREKRKGLRTCFEGGGLIVAPGVFDGISARIADTEGFDALYMTGYGVSASKFCSRFVLKTRHLLTSLPA
jgi:2-methylisocitrate lyase-like PEP mutase family enzyme